MKIWTRLSPPTPRSESRAELGRGETGRALARRGEQPLVVGYRAAGQLAEPNAGMGGILRRYPFAFAVLLPTMLVALYLFFVATPQYISEARFTIRSQAGMAGAGVAGSMLGGRASMGIVTEDENAVAAHLLSHDAVRALRERIDLVEIFRPPFADPVSRLWYADPSAERLLDHFRWQVRVVPDSYTGITTMTVRTYRPADSQELARLLLGLGEGKVVEINQRMLNETLRASREEVERAERRLAAAQAATTEFRQRERALNPTRSAEIAVGTIGALEAEATRLRTELQTLLGVARPGTLQIQNLRERIAAVEQQILAERARLADAQQGVTQQMAGFDRLQLELDLANRTLQAAVTGLEAATTNAQSQQIFLQRVVEPNLAERSLYPRPLLFTLYTLGGLTLVYGMVWLLVAGVREHAG
jgi:capsular polysaccharide transport system permease protein